MNQLIERLFARHPGLVLWLAVFVSAPLAAQQFKLAAFPETVRPGEPFVAAFAGPARPGVKQNARLSAGGRKIALAAFFSLNGESRYGPVRAAILAVPSTAAQGRALVTVEENGRTVGEIYITIENREFRSETLVLSQSMSNILSDPDPRKTKEAEKLWAILGRTGDEIFCTGKFVMPVNSQVQTSRFGGRRLYKYPDGRTGSSIHAGVDYRAPEGTPVTVCAPGRVVFAGPRIVTGNTVIIEHMPGVYSLCYHLSRISLVEGQIVSAGESLGAAGSTGFSTAAHLHWEIRVAGENTDPEAFLERTLLDKAAILAKLNE